ncbi:MAG: hypothetical protein B0W54_17140 [Cellvibrio sp. 79]|nr:MAG: hypothetical protein B0W54_17140 [Cellvibrio sp. 79]
MNKLISSFLLIYASVGLSGCGGGGGGGSKPTSTSNAQSSSTITSSSLAQSSSSAISSSLPATQLTINGAVSGDALAGGEVAFTLGAQTYKAAIDNSLKYSIALNVPAADSNKPFVAIATGGPGSAWVQLAALYPSVAALAEKAGSDKVLNADEYSAVNINALTTAEYAEIKNKQFPTATDAERKAAIYSLHPIRALEQAAMISRLLNDIHQDLPAQTKTTLDYLLNANLAETHLEVLRASSKLALSDYVEQVQEDLPPPNPSGTKIVGNYFLEALYSQYLLTFNADGTGKIVTANMGSIFDSFTATKVATGFTWTVKGATVKLTFNTPVKYGVSSLDDASGNWYPCDDNSTSVTERCDLQFKSVHLDLITETENYYLANLKIFVELTRENNGQQIYEGELEHQLARVVNTANFLTIKAADLVESELVSDKFSYVFNANGKVKQKNLVTQIETTLDWTLENNRVVVGDSTLWFTHKDLAGFGIFYADGENGYRTSLFKRTAVTMTDADWVGRWNQFPLDAFVATYDVNEDKSWRDGFEAQSAGNWSALNGHSQTSLSNGSWRMIRDVLSIHGDKYYMSICHGVESTPFNPSGCYLSVQQRNVNFDTAIFWRSWSSPAFNEKITKDPFISFWGLHFFKGNTLNNMVRRDYISVAANKFYNPFQQTILELTSASRNEIELCEYPFGGTCNDVNKRSYERAIEIKLSVGTGGKLFYPVAFEHLDYGYTTQFSRDIDKVLMVPRAQAQTITITPDSGFSLDSISGCGGILVGDTYKIPALTTACEIAVSFKK